ncbi:dolichyl-phosphate-mannose--protein mannosyltransferase [Nocardioides limicola]|uniref:dolichyl-phosphate-mannose--protein mannosyltransferase n=1 Tax=Nocardioides limicola TaxID=2803368 RepID=UPI0027DD3FD2|nr:phospholipid carrier-dependent glycosyltransferase [Nocardioides sp. DJM-14]
MSAVRSWSAAAAVGLLALALRLKDLGTPASFSFDETYYAKDAWSMLNHGWSRRYVDDANELILHGITTGTGPDGVWTDTPTMVVHPEVGKWMIAWGEWAFGMTPFGWRISAAITGALMVVVMVRLARRLTGSDWFGVFAGLLLCFDGLHLVLSRLALLDIFAAFWLLCGVHCVVADRQRTRARLAVRVAARELDTPWRMGPLAGEWFRPWLLLGGVAFGLAVGTKWSALVPLAGFGLLVWAWDSGAQRAIGVRWAIWKSAVVGGVPAFVQLVGVAFVVYVASWGGWLAHAEKYEDAYSATQYATFQDREPWPTADLPPAEGVERLARSLRSLAYYHRDVYTFHAHFLDDSEHTYQSHPAGWLILERPVGVEVHLDIQPGEQGCSAAAESTCLRQVLLIGTPVLWWVGVGALLFAVVWWAARRDWRFAVPVVGLATTWLPWFGYDDRPIFYFYAITILPFTVIALTLAAGVLIGPARGPSLRRTAGTVAVGTFLVLVVINFAWFWPIWTNGLLTHSQWLERIWFRGWI